MVKKLSKSSTDASTSSIAPPSTFSDGAALPKLIVFDLDYTVWPFWVDTHVSPPFKASADHSYAKDRTGESYAFYREVPSILYSLREKNIKVGVASRTQAPELGRELLRLLHIPDHEGKKRKAIEYFDYFEIYPGSKIAHFTKLQKATGLRYEDMLFFDDESRNKEVESLGVTMYLVRDGVTKEEVNKGVRNGGKDMDTHRVNILVPQLPQQGFFSTEFDLY